LFGFAHAQSGEQTKRTYDGQGQQIQRSHDVRRQSMLVFREFLSKYQLDHVVSDGSQTGQTLLGQIDKAKLNPAKFESTYRASKAVLSSIEGGVSYRDYASLIRPLQTEVSILKDTASTPEEQIVAQAYSDVANLYAAARRFWSSILDDSIRSNDLDIANNGGELSNSTLQKIAWPMAQIVSSRANEAYIRNYRSGDSSRPQTLPASSIRKSKQTGN
jgi:hypothetical protein